MRIVIVGAGSLAVMAARQLLKRGYEVVIVEREMDRIQSLSEELDCGFLNGDGSKPAILREADPQQTDILFCLTGNDQANILSALVGRSLGFKRVVPKIEDQELEHVCIELGLEDTIIPARTIGSYLSDMAEGRDPLQLRTLIREDARIFSFVVRQEDAGTVADLDLPDSSRVICVYRADRFILPEDDTALEAGDEVVLITRREKLEELEKRWTPGNH